MTRVRRLAGAMDMVQSKIPRNGDVSMLQGSARMCTRVSPELEIMCAPGRAYSRLSAESQVVTALGACYGPTIGAVTIGTAASISSTSHVSIGLVASVTACWAFFIGSQKIAAGVAMPSAARRAVVGARAIGLLFAGHAPWLMLLLACA